jgi:peptidoglycan hydrolase-like protein with peptidoglycan-binding domain
MPSRLAGRLRRGASDALEDVAPIDAEVASLEDELERRPPRRRRRARIAALAAVIAAVVAIALVVVLHSHHPKAKKQGSGVPAGETTTRVQRRTLTEHANIDGTLTYGSKLELFDRLSGTFTWLPATGTVIRRGGTLFKVNQLPIVLMYGSVPAYRALKEGVSKGADVEELNENLIALGYDPSGEITDYERFGSSTTAAVKLWQAAEGLPKTGEVELGRVVFAPGARRVTEVHVGLGQDPPGGSGSEAADAEEPAGDAEGSPAEGPEGSPAEGPEGSPTEEPASDGHANEQVGKAQKPAPEEPATKGVAKEPAGKELAAKRPAATEPSTKGPRAKEPAAKATEPAAKAPVKEAADQPGSTRSPSDSSGEDPGSTGEPSGGAGMLVLTTTSTRQLVQLSVEAAQQRLAHVGETAPVTLPNGNSVRGHITNVGTVATESSGEGGEAKATISVTVSLERPVKRLDEAPVTVELVEESVKGVLTVPATALIATAGGRYAIETLQNGRRAQLEVTPGMFADGYVQIEGRDVHDGLLVTEPSE